jgi:hypothetical protein
MGSQAVMPSLAPEWTSVLTSVSRIGAADAEKREL